ncbi:MAG TPA: type ISP restriction/modification enzyme, partial [Pyrinomonadaceae bacterium]|nr:type ISP restriction/modification enzyme [Pyrinomonadaceae bacterium]
KFSEELTVPGPRLPITRDAQLFCRAVEHGRRLIWLHTFGERFVPAGQRRGAVLQGRARCLRGVPTTPDDYPTEFSHESTPQRMRVGAGEFSPVPDAVWQFSVSGLSVLQSWLNYRMKGGAGRQTSPLDKIRPQQWTAAMTQELLELIWVLEATVETFPLLEETFNRVLETETFRAIEFPQPTDEERRPPTEQEDEETTQIELPEM